MTPTRLIHLHGQPIAGGKLPLICAPLVGRRHEDVLAEVAAVLPKSPDLLEWRVDHFAALGDVQAVIETARAIRAAAARTPLLFTRRSVREGGQPGDWAEADVVHMHEQVCAAGCVDLVDWEMSADAASFARIRAATRTHGLPLVASYHNFQRTPDADWLVTKFAEAERLGADVAKVAVMPNGPQDVLTLLAATHTASQSVKLPLISMAMGAYGSLSRIIGWAFGSTVSFAVGKDPSAPGQMPIDELRSALQISRRAVLGTRDAAPPLSS